MVFFPVDESPERGFASRAVGFFIFTEADTLAELRQNVREAVECHLDDGATPKLIRLHIVQDEVLMWPSSFTEPVHDPAAAPSCYLATRIGKRLTTALEKLDALSVLLEAESVHY